MAAALQLTPQQQAIVDHDTGAALVVAVAGAGKTTAMVRRIARLVHERIFEPGHILATSFNRDANQRISAGLTRWPHCKTVNVRTLHGLGYSIIRQAGEQGYASKLSHQQQIDGGGFGTLKAALARARQQGLPYAPLLDRLDWEDFLAYVGANKGNLAYADLRAAGLPRRVHKLARQATAPVDKPWYLDLYRLFESVRISQGRLTFDDMLLDGWTLLVKHPALLASVQRRYRCVLVDEYQDVNLVQSEILDLLVKPHGNLMAIGDDDQTIYEWRGANPHFFQQFARRYRAKIYYMTDNFRARASQLALANQLMRDKGGRGQSKQLDLTRGFGGHTGVQIHGSAAEMGHAIAVEVKRLLTVGVKPREMAVLVRAYAQTPPIEQAFAGARIPHRLVGAAPYHQRVYGRKGKADASAKKQGENAVTLISIYRAKGMEWPVVFVPNCNVGVMPLAKSEFPDEERRLFYVALTRAQERLYLHALGDAPRSPFLIDTNYDDVLAALRGVEGALARDPTAWTAADYLAIGVNARRLYLHNYLARWWPADAEQRYRVAYAVLAFYATLRKRRRFKQLQLTRADTRFWQDIAGARLSPPPLELAGLDELLGTV